METAFLTRKWFILALKGSNILLSLFEDCIRKLGVHLQRGGGGGGGVRKAARVSGLMPDLR